MRGFPTDPCYKEGLKKGSFLSRNHAHKSVKSRFTLKYVDLSGFTLIYVYALYKYHGHEGRRGHDRTVVIFTTTCVISAYDH